MILFCGMIDDWARMKIVYVMEITFMFVGHLVMLMLYNPSTNFNKSFPFHTLTAALELQKGDAGKLGGVENENDNGGSGGVNSLDNNLLNSISGGLKVRDGGYDGYGKLIIANPYESSSVEELRKLNRYIQHVSDSLREQQSVLQNVLNNISGGEELGSGGGGGGGGGGGNNKGSGGGGGGGGSHEGDVTYGTNVHNLHARKGSFTGDNNSHAHNINAQRRMENNRRGGGNFSAPRKQNSSNVF